MTMQSRHQYLLTVASSARQMAEITYKIGTIISGYCLAQRRRKLIPTSSLEARNGQRNSCKLINLMISTSCGFEFLIQSEGEDGRSSCSLALQSLLERRWRF